MAKKSRATGTEPLSGDILDLIWIKVINPDPGGVWLDDALKKSTDAAEPLKAVGSAIKRLLATKASRDDLGRLARMERYERCFGLLYELDDPGLRSGKLSGLRKQLLNPPARGGKETEFMAVLWEGIGEADDGGERWTRISPQSQAKDEPFGDTNPAVARLLKAGVQPRDLELFARWQRFDATVELLRLFERAGITEAEELLGLHESILSAEPSEKEARPGSWPPAAKAQSGLAASTDPTQPFLVLKSIEAFGYTPDGKGLLVSPKAGPYRILDSETGQERVVLNAKGSLLGWEFSNDGRRVLVVSGSKNIVVCDSVTGQQLKSFAWPGRIAALSILKVPQGDELLASTAVRNPDRGETSAYYRFNGSTLTAGEAVSFLPENTTTSQLEFTPDGKSLIAFFSTLAGNDVPPSYELRAWSWPEMKPRWNAARVPKGGNWGLTCSRDGRLVAAATMDGEVVVLNAATGQQVAKLKSEDESNHVAFAADGRHLVTGEHGTGKIRIWDIPAQRTVREFGTGTGWCFGVCFSPDGKILAAASHRKSLFWRFDALTNG